MAIDEQRRHEMYLQFERLMGQEVAATVMEHLPPVGWADVATKHDLEREITIVRSEMTAGFAAIDARFDAMESRFAAVDFQFAVVTSGFETGFAQLREQIADTNRRTVMWLSGVMFTGLAAVFTALVTTR